MKKLPIIAALGLSLSFAACDSISEEDRFVPTEIVPQRSILLEEFTGQSCTNCPDGHAAIKDITASLGDSVVPVGIHASSLAMNPPLGLRTATGDAYYAAVGSPALPTATINMETPPLQVADWGAQINHLIMEPTPFTVIAEGTANDGNFDIKVAFSSGEDYEGKLMVWILENDIIRRQLDHGVWISDYEHQHVFRAAVTEDIWGEDVSLSANTPQYREFSYPIDQFWVADNLYVVAFLYNEGGVAQITQSVSNHH